MVRIHDQIGTSNVSAARVVERWFNEAVDLGPYDKQSPRKSIYRSLRFAFDAARNSGHPAGVETWFGWEVLNAAGCWSAEAWRHIRRLQSPPRARCGCCVRGAAPPGVARHRGRIRRRRVE